MKWMPSGAAATGLLAALTSATMTGTASAAPVSPQIRNATATAAVTTAAATTAAAIEPAATGPAATAPAATAAAGPRVPRLDWRACHHGFQCATARVPLDYRHPDGATVRLAVIRHLATGGKRSARTLFVNGGGPSAQIAGFVASYAALPAALRARFTLITFDERGFGRSSAVQCFPSAAAENTFLAGLPPAFPVGARQEAAWVTTIARFGGVCARHGGDLIQHATSTDDARDMNLLRQAVGVRKLNYVGISYGTVLGAVYANLFPATVGRMVLDGNLDPVAWSKGGRLPDALRQGSDLATASVLRSFLNLCGQAATAACAFSAGTPAATRAKYATLLRRLLRHPVTAGSPPQRFTYATTINDVPLGLLAFTRDWPQAASLLQQLWTASAASAASHAVPASGAARRVRHAAYAGPEQQLAQECADIADPHSVRAFRAAARLGKARSGGIGLGYAWEEEPCAAWPAGPSPDRYTGPWNHRTASPILVVGNTGDPITPYGSAVAMSRDLARARLLTVREFGHTASLNPDTCFMHYELRYLATGALPPAGTVCPQDAPPFAGR